MAANPIQLISQNFYKELSSAPVNWLLANAGDKIRVETTFSVAVYAMSDSNNQFILNNNDGYIGAGWIQDPQNQFDNFNIGDSVTLYDYTTNAELFAGTILAKADDGNIQLSAAIASTPAGTQSGTVVLSLATPITGIKYHYNMITNSASDTFTSMVDGVSEQVIVARNKLVTDTTATAMEALGALTWQDGQAGFVTLPFGGGSAVPVATIQGVSNSTSPIYTSTFKIVHYTKVSPYLLYNMTVPPYTDTNCLKFITKIDALQAYDNPNLIYTTSFDSVNGNVGWENENFTTGKTNYSISNVTYTNNAQTVGALILNSSETTLTFNINNTVDVPFSNNNTQFVLNFFKVPADASEYQGTGNLMDVNFLYDRVLQKVGSSAVNGDNYGGTYQVLKSVSATYVSASQILVTAKFDMSAAVLAGFNASSLPQYKLTVITQNYSKATNVSDLVTLVVDSQPFTVVTSDPGMIVIDNTTFLRHPEFNPTTEGVVVGSEVGGSYATLTVNASYQASAWSGSGSIGLFLDPVSPTFYFGAARSWTSATHTNLDDAMNDIVGQMNTSSGSTLASYNAATHTLSIQAPVKGSAWNGCYINIPAYSVSISFGSTYFSGGVDPTYTTFDTYPEDEVVACSTFYVESSGRTTDTIILQSINAKVVATNGSSTFELDQFTMSLSGYPLIGYTQQFDAQVARAFHVPADSIRKFIEIKRRNDLDTGTRKYFSSNYPFMIRWETWVQVLGVDPSFFNSALPNNGFNEWWYQYGQAAGWGIEYQLTLKATENGTAQTYATSVPFNIHNYRSNSAYTVKEALTFDPNGTTQLVTGGSTNVTIGGQLYYTVFTKQFLYNYKNTLAVAIFTKTSLPANVTVVLRLEIWQQGGIYGIRTFSSRWQGDSDTWFLSVDQVNYPNKVKLQAFGNSIVATALINALALPQNIASWKLSARIYEITNGLETDDGVPILNDNGVQITVD